LTLLWTHENVSLVKTTQTEKELSNGLCI